MKLEEVEDSTYCGERVGDLPREKLLEVIGELIDENRREKESHATTLRMLTIATKGR